MAEQTVVAAHNNVAGIESALRTRDRGGFPVKLVSVADWDQSMHPA